jgi:hypothetical protein
MGALKEFGRLFGFGLSEAEKERRARLRALRQETRREDEGADAFYPMRDKAIRTARQTETGAILDALGIAESDAIRKRGSAEYRAALGVVAGLKQVLRERNVKVLGVPRLTIGEALSVLGLEGGETANEAAHAYGMRVRRASPAEKTRLDAAYETVMRTKGRA